jgi:hypothetical protein
MICTVTKAEMSYRLLWNRLRNFNPLSTSRCWYLAFKLKNMSSLDHACRGRVRTLVYPSQLTGGDECRSNNRLAGNDTSQLHRVRTLVYPSQLTGGCECRSNKRVGRDDTSQLLRVRTLVYPSQLTGGGECRSHKRVGRGQYITVAQGPHSNVPKPTHWC